MSLNLTFSQKCQSRNLKVVRSIRTDCKYCFARGLELIAFKLNYILRVEVFGVFIRFDKEQFSYERLAI